MPNVSLTQSALNDLDEIADHLSAELGHIAALAIMHRLKTHCTSLASMPFRFQAVETFANLRRCPCESWQIFYTVGEEVKILRILHQSRQPTDALFDY